MLDFGTYDIASRRPWSYFLAVRRCSKICSTNLKSNSSKPPKPLIDRTARVATLADAPDLGSGSARNVGSSPTPSTSLLFLILTDNKITFVIPIRRGRGAFFLPSSMSRTAGMPLPARLPKGSRKYPRKEEIFIAHKSSFFLS